jgi:HSP20 family protein
MARISVGRRDPFAADDELRGFLEALLQRTDPGSRAECSLPLDVVETAAAIELVMDLPGVAPEDVSVRYVQSTLVIMGRKRPAGCQHSGAAFHLVERTFGRFVRAVRITGAFDAGRADARLGAGELRVTLPRIQERRGTELRIPVRSE